MHLNYWGTEVVSPADAPGGWLGFGLDLLKPPDKSHLNADSLLIAVPALSLAEIVERMPEDALIRQQLWWRDLPFAAETEAPSWTVLDMRRADNAEGRTLEQILGDVRQAGRVPSARVLAYAMFAVKQKTGSTVFDTVSAISSDVTHDGAVVVVGGRERWLGIHAFRTSTVDRRLGLVTQRL